MVWNEGRGRSAVAQLLTVVILEMEGCSIRQAEEFLINDTQGACGQIPQRRSSDRVPRASAKNRWEKGLRSVGFPLEVWIGNEVPTFNTADLAIVVFFFRDAVGDQTTMSTGAG
jgi:hypothetical protein